MIRRGGKSKRGGRPDANPPVVLPEDRAGARIGVPLPVASCLSCRHAFLVDRYTGRLRSPSLADRLALKAAFAAHGLDEPMLGRRRKTTDGDHLLWACRYSRGPRRLKLEEEGKS